MKNIIIRRLLWGLLILPALSFFGCSDDDNTRSPNKLYFHIYDVPSTSRDYNRLTGIYETTPAGSSMLKDINIKFPCRATQALASDVNLEIMVDMSLVDQFNTQYGTEYVPMPDGVLKLTNTTLHIKKGEYISYDSISVETADFSRIEHGKSYIAPISVKSIKGGSNCTASVNRGTVYVVIDATYSNCLNNATADDMTGELAASRAGWTAVIESTPSFNDAANMYKIFDGSTGTYVYRTYDEYAITVDMQEEYTITGFRFHVYSSYYTINQIIVYTSNDGENFEEQGSPKLAIVSGWQYVKFYTPINTRFVKFKRVSSALRDLPLTEFITYVQ